MNDFARSRAAFCYLRVAGDSFAQFVGGEVRAWFPWVRSCWAIRLAGLLEKTRS